MTATGDLPGTLRYMSPEQALGKRSLVDRRSDVYALGTTIYELLTLESAVDGRERWEILAHVERSQPVPIDRYNPAVPEALATIIAHAMAKDVSSRYQSAGDFAHDLKSFLDGRSIKAKRVKWGEHTIRWCSRNPTIAGLLMALVAVLFLGFLAVTVEWRRANAEATRANSTAQRESEAARQGAGRGQHSRFRPRPRVRQAR